MKTNRLLCHVKCVVWVCVATLSPFLGVDAGCFSDKEHWFRLDTQGAHLTGVTGESCCTYNMLKLARRLFALNPRIETADYIESPSRSPWKGASPISCR